MTCICRFANKESKYFYNGVNFFLVTLGQENGVWKVVLFSQAPATVIESATPISAPISNDGSYVNSADIEKALNIIRSRYEGVILGSEGSVIETNIASSEQLAEEKGLSSADISTKINQFFIKNQYAYGGAATTDFLSIMMDIIRNLKICFLDGV